MSELLDKQVYVLMTVSNRNSGIHGGGHASPRKVYDENKRKKEKRRPRKKFLMTGRTLYGYTPVSEV